MKLNFNRDYRHPTWGLFLPGTYEVDDEFGKDLLKRHPDLVQKVKQKAPENKQKTSKKMR